MVLETRLLSRVGDRAVVGALAKYRSVMVPAVTTAVLACRTCTTDPFRIIAGLPTSHHLAAFTVVASSACFTPVAGRTTTGAILTHCGTGAFVIDTRRANCTDPLGIVALFSASHNFAALPAIASVARFTFYGEATIHTDTALAEVAWAAAVRANVGRIHAGPFVTDVAWTARAWANIGAFIDVRLPRSRALNANRGG